MALTGKNEIVGTLYYMSPEQLQAQADGRDIDARSDIFSFGLVLYELLTGKRAFEGASPASVIAAIMERPAPSLADVAPPALDRVLKTLPGERSRRSLAVRPRPEARTGVDCRRRRAPEPAAARTLDGRTRPTGVDRGTGAVAAAALAFVLWTAPADAQTTSARLTIPLPPGHEITTYPAITRDGRDGGVRHAAGQRRRAALSARS